MAQATEVRAPGTGELEQGANLLEVRHVVQEFVVRGHGGVKGGVVQAVTDVSFDVKKGETLGIVGETGSGKSTLVRSILQAPSPKSGSVIFEGTDLVKTKRRDLLAIRRHIQMVFQDPYNSVDPKWRVSDIVEEPLIAAHIGTRLERKRRVAELLELVGLDVGEHGPRRARELSGGQCQRVAIARALALNPALIICDEAVSSLDVLVQAQVLNLFEKLRAEFNLSYLFVAHDLALVKQVSDRVAVMYLGKLCEIGPADWIYQEPLHPYTVALLAAIPRPDPDSEGPQTGGVISGEPPSPIDPPSGCRFRTRCPRAEQRCADEIPELRAPGDHPDHLVACHFPVAPPAVEEQVPATA
jgi:oligopeptide/dipeptide ABC transporter ATP-binding protein